jgi:glycosyltransferase involved in cell wall biosynthesis
MEQRSLHIGFLTDEYIIPPDHLDGGLATYLQKTGRGLVKRGQRVSVFCLSDRDYDWIDEGVHIHEVLAEPRKLSRVLSNIALPTAEIEKIFLNSTKLAARVRQVNLTEPLDILQAASYQAVGIAMCDNRSIPLITRVSSLPPLVRNATGGNNVNTLSSALSDWCEIYQAENSDCTFSPSALMAKYYSLYSQVSPLILRSPIDADNETTDESFYDRHLKGMKYLLFFGTLNRLKGMELISKSVGGLIEEFPNIHFVFIGRTHLAENDQPYAAKILQENVRWSKNIHYYPSLPKKSLFPVIRHAYGVLIPSLIDNYPNSCLEALQCGKIVIGTYESSLDEMISDGETGILVQNNDVESLQSGIRKLLGFSPVQKKEMEGKIVKTFAGMVSEDRIGQLVALYNDTILNYKPNVHTDSINFERLLLQKKFRKDLGIGIVSGVFLNTVQRWNYSQKRSRLGSKAKKLI